MPNTRTVAHRFLTAREVADAFGTDVRTVHRHAKSGELPTVGRLGKAYIFDADTIDAIKRGTRNAS